MMDKQGSWLPILEYARYRNISISTIRRMIKAQRVEWRLDEGKYSIFVSEERLQKKKVEENNLRQENERLRKLLCAKENEIAELIMLVKIYEQKEIPPLPLELQGICQ